jgi:hypothetical protein
MPRISKRMVVETWNELSDCDVERMRLLRDSPGAAASKRGARPRRPRDLRLVSMDWSELTALGKRVLEYDDAIG